MSSFSFAYLIRALGYLGTWEGESTTPTFSGHWKWKEAAVLREFVPFTTALFDHFSFYQFSCSLFCISMGYSLKLHLHRFCRSIPEVYRPGGLLPPVDAPIIQHIWKMLISVDSDTSDNTPVLDPLITLAAHPPLCRVCWPLTIRRETLFWIFLAASN